MTLLATTQPDTSTRLFADDLARHGDRPALITADGFVSYAELDRKVAALAARLGERRLVAVEAANTINAVAAYLAALRGGHALLLLPQAEATAQRLVEAYDADVVLSAHSEWEPSERRPGSAHLLHPELALLLPTSGSTGSSKLVRLSRDNLQSNAAAIAEYLCITTDHRAATTLPMQYCYGLSVINSHLAVGAGLVLTELSVVDACFWDVFRNAGATSFAGVPYTFELLDRIGFESMSLPALRYVTQAGGRLQPDEVRRYAELGRARGWQLYVMYGQTEATARMAYLPPELADVYPEAIGVPVPGGSFRIEPIDEAGDGTGELVYRGPNVMLGYARTAVDLSLGQTIDELRTGDIARRNSHGLYEIVGRRSRFIKPYGIRVDLEQLELAIAARGTTSLCTGDDETLDIAVERGVDMSAVMAEVRRVAAVPASRVRIVEFEHLPRLPSGKSDYIKVRQRAAAQAPPASLPTSSQSGLPALFAEVLGREVADDESFVSAGGDSLSYVELSIALEERLGSLPRDWHVRPIRELIPKRGGRRLFRAVETSVALRALAIVLIVGTHVGLWHLPGGAHVLLGVAGYNFARFQLLGGAIGRTIARIAVPSVCWIGAVAAMSEKYGWPNALLINGLVGRPGDEWGYWFIEALIYILIPLAALLAVPSVRRFERRWPFGVAFGVALAALAVRFDVIDLPSMQYGTSRPHEVFWLFALGWAAAVAATGPRRMLVSALVVVSVPGFFGDLHREALIVAGLLLVLWAPTLRLPAALTRVAGTLAAASLYIYLTHWQVFPLVERHVGRPAAVLAALGAGVAAFVVAGAITTRLSALARGHDSPRGREGSFGHARRNREADRSFHLRRPVPRIGVVR
ncbi:MAG: AMP-binding protein [Actinobacteria bacterium]|nr:AMP-binding protein [Actinomycetota bacterium]